jgi:hypothetical protein
VHCPDPLAVLYQCGKAAAETLVIFEGGFEFAQPVMGFGGGRENYYPADSLYRKYLSPCHG